MSRTIFWIIGFVTMSASAAVMAQTKLELADALIAVMPQEFRQETIDQDEQAKLEGLNPEKQAVIAEVLTTHSKCVTPVINQFTRRLLQRVAMSLSEEQIRSLTGFYQSSEFTRFAELSDKSDAGQTLTDAENQYMAKMMANYPMVDFYNAMQEQGKSASKDQAFIAQVSRCSLDKEAAFIKAKITFR